MSDIVEALHHECVMPEIGVMSLRGQTEKHHDRLPENVSSLYRHIERGIIQPSLGAPHPVEDTFRLRV